MARMDYRVVHTLSDAHVTQLHELYQGEWWTRGRTLEATRTLLEHSDLVFALCEPATDRLVAFARVLTDRVFKALIFDVIVQADLRSQGVGQRLVEEVISHPVLAGVEHIELYCRPERFEFYRRLGFSEDLGSLKLMRRNRV